MTEVNDCQANYVVCVCLQQIDDVCVTFSEM